jgi:hypothetical protein
VRKSCEGSFAFKALGPAKVKGVADPVNLYEVAGFEPLRTRLQRSASRGYTKFVGRQREMETMKAAAEQALAVHGQILAAVAEPGVGKSRLFYEFKARSAAGLDGSGEDREKIGKGRMLVTRADYRLRPRPARSVPRSTCRSVNYKTSSERPSCQWPTTRALDLNGSGAQEQRGWG